MSAPTSATSAPVHCIPAETLCYIFDLAATSSKQTAVQASLVCRSWREPAQRALFLKVELNLQLTDELKEEEAKRKCASLLASPAFERHRVRELRLTTGRALADDAAEVLAACTGLKHLLLQTKFTEDMDDKFDEESSWSWEVLSTSALSDLESLHLQYPEHFENSTGPHTFPSHLKKFVIWTLADSPPSSAAISAIFSTSSHSMTQVHVHTQTPTNPTWMDEQVLARAGPVVRHLEFTIDCVDSSPTPSTAIAVEYPALSSFSDLRTLEVTPGVMGGRDVGRVSAVATRLFHALPPTSGPSSLVISGPYYYPHKVISIQSLIECLATPAAASIRRIDFPTLDRQDVEKVCDVEEWEKLEKNCGEASIAIYLRQDLLSAGLLRIPDFF